MTNRLLILLSFLLLAACGRQEATISPEILQIGVLPDQSPEQLLLRYEDLIKYLEAETGLRANLVIPDDYESMLQAFVAGDLHVVHFGGLLFAKAEAAAGAEPLVMRDIDLNFRSCYVVKSEDSRSSLRDFGNTNLSFGPRLSTSGHLMPRYFLNELSITPEEFFSSIKHSGGHDETAYRVRDGIVDIGVMNCSILDAMLRSERISESEIRVLSRTPAYADYVWAVQKDLDDTIKNSIRDAFLAIDATKTEHRKLLVKLKANAYLPAGRADFEEVRQAASAIEVFTD